MKFGLAFLLCSYIAESCLPTYFHDFEFDSEYECMVAGYSESLKKIQEIGPVDVNEYRMYIKFGCFEVTGIEENT